MNKKVIAVSVLIAILFAGTISGTVFYYNGITKDRNSEIASLNNKITNLNTKISNLTVQLTNLTSANLVTIALGVTEVPYNSQISLNSALPPDNYLYITGLVTNTGDGIAYNAGLHVIAYDATGTLEINTTVPLTAGTVYIDSSLPLGNLVGGQNATIEIVLYHEGTVTNWTVTPVWTNTQT